MVDKVVPADRTPRIRGIGTDLHALAAELQQSSDATADRIAQLELQNQSLRNELENKKKECERLQKKWERDRNY